MRLFCLEVLCGFLGCGQLLYYFYQRLLRFCCNGATNRGKVIRFSFMSGVCQINIVESAPSLKALLGQQKTASGKEPVQALYINEDSASRNCPRSSSMFGTRSALRSSASLSRYSTTLVTPISSRWTQETVDGWEKQRKTESHSRWGN